MPVSPASATRTSLLQIELLMMDPSFLPAIPPRSRSILHRCAATQVAAIDCAWPAAQRPRLRCVLVCFPFACSREWVALRCPPPFSKVLLHKLANVVGLHKENSNMRPRGVLPNRQTLHYYGIYIVKYRISRGELAR